jgi:predicted DCC family thiol-disulfide oxidoreductase YuxK
MVRQFKKAAGLLKIKAPWSFQTWGTTHPTTQHHITKTWVHSQKIFTRSSNKGIMKSWQIFTFSIWSTKSTIVSQAFCFHYMLQAQHVKDTAVCVTAMKAYRESTAIVTIILNLATRWGWMVNFMPWPLYLWGKTPWYPLNRRLGVPQSWRGCFGEEEKAPSPAGNGNTDPPADMLVLYWLQAVYEVRRESSTPGNPGILCYKNSALILMMNTGTELKGTTGQNKLQPQLLPLGTCDIQWVMDTLFVPAKCLALLPHMPSGVSMHLGAVNWWLL